jgi:hypothetical protein
MAVYLNPEYSTHPTTPCWTYEACTDTLVHLSHFSGHYWLPLHGRPLEFWLAHLSDKRWATRQDLLDLGNVFTQASELVDA